MKKWSLCGGISLGVSLLILLISPLNATAGQYEQLMSLLINLNGWEAGAPEAWILLPAI